MTKLALVYALLISAVSAGCSSGKEATNPRDDMKARRSALRGEVQAEADDDAVRIAAAAGYDYTSVVTDCLLRDEQAMHMLFEMTVKAGFDGCAAEGHAGMLGHILRDVGDRFFGECLAAETDASQAAVRSGLLYELGFGQGPSCPDIDYFQGLYPKTFPANCALLFSEE